METREFCWFWLLLSLDSQNKIVFCYLILYLNTFTNLCRGHIIIKLRLTLSNCELCVSSKIISLSNFSEIITADVGNGTLVAQSLGYVSGS